MKTRIKTFFRYPYLKLLTVYTKKLDMLLLVLFYQESALSAFCSKKLISEAYHLSGKIQTCSQG